MSTAHVSDVFNITDALLVMASLRVDRFESKGTYNQATQTIVANTKYGQTALSPKFGLVYQVVKDQVAIFGNYMNAFRNVAPVTQPLAEVPGTFKPQQANQVEGGVWTWWPTPSAGPADLVNAWISYVFLQGTLKGFGLGFGGNYAGENIVTNSAPTGIFTIPAYTVLNSSIFYNTQCYRIGIMLNNLANKAYFKGWTTVEPQMPRQLMANISYKF